MVSMNTKPLTNELIAELLRPIDALLAPQIGAVNPRLVDQFAEAEVDRAIECFARSADLTVIDDLSIPGKAALRNRILTASAIAAIAPYEVTLNIPKEADEAEMRTFSIIALHRRPEELLNLLRHSLH
jgi:hypothetical protein